MNNTYNSTSTRDWCSGNFANILNFIKIPLENIEKSPNHQTKPNPTISTMSASSAILFQQYAL